MALSVSSDRHRRLHGRQVVSDPEVHRGTLRPGVRPDGGGGLLLSPGGDRAGQENQTTDLGHCGAGEVQVKSQLVHLPLDPSHPSTKRHHDRQTKVTILLFHVFLLRVKNPDQHDKRMSRSDWMSQMGIQDDLIETSQNHF